MISEIMHKIIQVFTYHILEKIYYTLHHSFITTKIHNSKIITENNVYTGVLCIYQLL